MARASRFTPWLTPREDLEAMFVARQALLDDLVSRIEHAAQTVSRNHTLLIGQRGSGKTHLLAMTYYRLEDMMSQGSQLQVARLPEDPWTIVSYRHLLVAILSALGEAAPLVSEADLEHQLNQLHQANGVIVVLVENLDEIFAQIKPKGQQRLRHFLQSSPALLLLATTPILDRSLTDQASAFYNFFSTLSLAPLTTDQAQALVTHLAQSRGDQELVEALQQPLTRRRLDAIQRLAGGQPRLWVTFGQILRMADIDRVADVLWESFDDLTPYYEDRLRALSGQQRLVVAELAAVDRPLHNQELAQRLDLIPTSSARTLGELRDSGWVVKVVTPWDGLIDGRRSYYELAEPLVRLAFQIKDSVNQPLRLIIDFLSYWFDPEDIATRQGDGLAGSYLLELKAVFDADPSLRVARRLTHLPDSKAGDVELLGQVDDALAALGRGHPEPIMALPSNIRAALVERWGGGPDGVDTGAGRDLAAAATQLRFEIHEAAIKETGDVPREPQSSQWIARSEDLVGSEVNPPRALSIWSRWLAHCRQLDQAQAVVDLIDWSSSPDPAYYARLELGTAAFRDGQVQRSISQLSQLLNDCQSTWGEDSSQSLIVSNNLAVVLDAAGEVEQAIALHQQILATKQRVHGPDHIDTLSSLTNLAHAYWTAGKVSRAIGLLEEVAAAKERVYGSGHPETQKARTNLALARQ